MEEQNPSDCNSNERPGWAEIERNPAGLRVETDVGTYTFHRDFDADGDVWVPDNGPPREVVAILREQDYDVRCESVW